MKKYLDVNGKVLSLPKDEMVVLSDGNFQVNGFLIINISVRQYISKIDDDLGPYSILTCIVETDKGTIEILYDEGFHGTNALQESVMFLKNNLGVSGLILRSVISLESMLDEEKK